MGENGLGGLAVLAAISKVGNEKKTYNHLYIFSIIVLVALEWKRANVFFRAVVKGN